MNPETVIVGYSEKEATTKAWTFAYTNQGRSSAVVTPDKLVVRQQEGEKNQAGYRMQEKTYQLIDDNTMLITSIGEANGKEPTSDPPLTVKRQQNAGSNP